MSSDYANICFCASTWHYQKLILESWVFSTELSSSEQAGHENYNPAKSDTSAVKSGYTWKISYGDGSGASGDVYTDTVTVGGTTVKGQAVELASKISAQFQRDTDDDGLLGLSFSSGNRGKSPSLSLLVKNL